MFSVDIILAIWLVLHHGFTPVNTDTSISSPSGGVDSSIDARKHLAVTLSAEDKKTIERAKEAKRMREYRIRRPEYFKHCSKRYRDGLSQENKEKKKAYLLAYRAKNRDALIKVGRARYMANRKELLAWKAAHPPDPEKRKAYIRGYYQKNKYRYAAYLKARRKASVADKAELERIAVFIQTIRESKSIRCYYCPRKLPGSKMHIEHIVPLTKKGTHTTDNLCAACPRCNLTKRNKLLTQWQPDTSQQVLPL